jgi:hypothetical protein
MAYVDSFNMRSAVNLKGIIRSVDGFDMIPTVVPLFKRKRLNRLYVFQISRLIMMLVLRR